MSYMVYIEEEAIKEVYALKRGLRLNARETVSLHE